MALLSHFYDTLAGGLWSEYLTLRHKYVIIVELAQSMLGLRSYQVSAGIYTIRQLAYYIDCYPRGTRCVICLCSSRECSVRTNCH